MQNFTSWLMSVLYSWQVMHWKCPVDADRNRGRPRI